MKAQKGLNISWNKVKVKVSKVLTYDIVYHEFTSNKY